jgi:hypothetical protein
MRLLPRGHAPSPFAARVQSPPSRSVVPWATAGSFFCRTDTDKEAGDVLHEEGILSDSHSSRLVLRCDTEEKVRPIRGRRERGPMRERLVSLNALLLGPTLSAATAPAVKLPGSGTLTVVRLQEESQ